MNGIKQPSVNDSTTKLDPQEYTNELGHVVPNIIYTMEASSMNTGPWYLSKFNIKYG